MLFKSCANFLLIVVPFVFAAEDGEKSRIRDERRYTQTKANNFAPLGFYSSEHALRGTSSDKAKIQQQNKFSNINEIGVENDSQKEPLMETESKYADKSSTHSTPALSALALLGFLYYLNLIQGTNGRRKRSVESHSAEAEEGLQDYLTAIEGVLSKFSNLFQDGTQKAKVEGRNLDNFNGDISSRGTVQERAFRIIDFVSLLFGKISQTLGLSDESISRNDHIEDPSSHSSGPNLWNFFGRRVGLVARIMDFLEDPSPNRIGRSFSEVERSDIDPNEEYAEPSELSDEEKAFLPFYSTEDHSRKKRFTNDEMNIWYSEAVNHAEENPSQFGDSGRLVGMVMNLFKNALTS